MSLLDWKSATVSRIGAIVVLPVFLGACALTANQKAALDQFSSSASALGDVTTSELTAMREGTVKMNSERLLLGGPSKDPRLGDQTSLDRGFELDRIQTISGATRALAAYGKTLAALVSDTQSAELKAASNDFVGSLGRVPAVKEHASEKQLEAIGTAIQKIGGLWIDSKRRQAVTTIVTSSEGAVAHLCDLLIRDFDPKSGWVALQLQVVEDPLIAEATNALANGKTYEDRKTALDAIRLAHDSRMRRTEVLKRVTQAAGAMKKANAALAQVVKGSKWSFQDIHGFVKEAQSLQEAVRSIVTQSKG